MTVNYIEKGYGMHLYIAAHGYEMWNMNGLYYSNDDVAVQALIDAYGAQDAIAHQKTVIKDRARVYYDKLIEPYSAGEMSQWDTLRYEALYYTQTNDPDTCPTIKKEAEDRGIEIQALVSKIMDKSALFRGVRSAIAANSGRHRDIVSTLTDLGEVIAYDFSGGWPLLGVI